MKSAENTSIASGSAIHGYLLYASILLLIMIVHLTQSSIQTLLRFYSEQSNVHFSAGTLSTILFNMSLLKGVLFLLSLGVLLFPLVKDSYRNLRDSRPSNFLRLMLIAASIAIFLAVLDFIPRISSYGVTYAEMSIDPFGIATSLQSTRLLMPVIAHILFFQGLWAYYVFSMVLAVILIALLYTWIVEYAPLPLWQFISLCTCSFLMFQFQTPGYPDVLVFMAFVLLMRSDMSDESKLSLLILALIAHESSVFVGLVLAWRYLRRRECILYVLAILFYAAVWAAVYGFNIPGILAVRNVLGMSGFEWVLHSPSLEILGVFMAFKALWLFLLLAVFLALRHRQFRDAVFMVASVVMGLWMTMLGVDTSRLMGFAMPGLLMALCVIDRNMPQKPAKWILSCVFAINLIIPSLNVKLHEGISELPGLYGILYHWTNLLWHG